jgi:anti-sigma B factor antagonist
VALTFSTRRVGDVVVVSCAGELALGEEIAALEAHLDAAIAVNARVLLDLSAVSFIDSAALGMLVRYVCRTQNAAGVLRICAVSAPIDRALVVSRLKPVVQPFDSVETAIADAYDAQRETFSFPDILCVDDSEDVLAYLRELLRSDGHHAMTASNLPDALILLKAARPRVIVLGEAARATAGTRSADEFHRAAAACRVVNLPAGFAREEAGEAGRQVLAAIRDVSPERPDS